MKYYYYGYDDTNYGPAKKSEIHESKDLEHAQKNAYRMVKAGWPVVCIAGKPSYEKRSIIRIVSFDVRLNKMIAMNTMRKSRPIYILKSDGRARRP